MEDIYIDTNVFLVFLKKEENFDHAKAILQKVATGNGRGFVSPLTLHELLWVLEKEKMPYAKAKSALDFIAHHPNISLLTPSVKTFYSALDKDVLLCPGHKTREKSQNSRLFACSDNVGK